TARVRRDDSLGTLVHSALRGEACAAGTPAPAHHRNPGPGQTQREREPWLLASNLPEERWSAAQVVAIYKRRMQIEEGFRDLK
ncbi:transposase, partial [Azotobacter chroococcum]|uniref:transposase n=1 Tax=Azotobacter chroococcum TaxID=353 RepID=UPI001F110F77